MYDLVIGGAGLYGATLAYHAKRNGMNVLVIEKDEIGSLCADPDGFSKYGPHIFHTDNRDQWDFVNSIAPFKPVHYSPLVQYKDELYSFPINKLTLHQLGMDGHVILDPEGDNFEDACIFAVGETLYEKFFYHYTKKMWGMEPKSLPASILKRIPVRDDYNTSYYNDRYVGVPEEGFSHFIACLLDGVKVIKGDFVDKHIDYHCRKVFTGSIDDFHYYIYGVLPYRGQRFEACASIDAMVINYTDHRKYTRKVNYEYLWRGITIMETPSDNIRHYPVPWGEALYNKYAVIPTDVEFAGRLGSYRYLNMNEVMDLAENDSHQPQA